MPKAAVATLHSMDSVSLTGLAAAFGIGLLVGVERERSTYDPKKAPPAGVRTFTLASLMGALATIVGGTFTLLAFGTIIGAFAALAYRRTDTDPGLTTEIALVVTYLLGALAMTRSTLAVAVGVVVTILLASRSWLHDIVRNRLSRDEVNDGLLLAASALVVLPLIPDRTVDPWGVLNPRMVWTLAVLFMAINGVGYLALRVFGASKGLPLAGFASGFVSSTATHGAFGTKARTNPEVLGAAVAGTALSSVATVAQLALVIAVTNPSLLNAMSIPLLLSGAFAAAYGGFFTWRTLREEKNGELPLGRAFNPRTAIGFALLMSAVIVGSALLVKWMGSQGALVAAAVSGFADAHAAAASSGTLLRAGSITLPDAATSILLGFSTNAITKLVLATTSGGAAFALRLAPGLVGMVAVAWIGYVLESVGA